MSKGKLDLSADFKKYMTQKQDVHEKARKAENSLMNIPLPIDCEFEAKVLDIKGSVSSNGNPTVTVIFTVTSSKPTDFAGRRVRWMNTFNTTENRTAEERLASFLDRLEMWGLPRQLRENYEHLQDVLEWLLEADVVVQGKVKKTDYNQEGKEVQWLSVAKAPSNNDMIGAPTPMAAPTVPEGKSVSKDEALPPGTKVMYNGTEYEIIEVSNGYASIKSLKSGRTRDEIEITELRVL